MTADLDNIELDGEVHRVSWSAGTHARVLHCYVVGYSEGDGALCGAVYSGPAARQLLDPCKRCQRTLANNQPAESSDNPPVLRRRGRPNIGPAVQVRLSAQQLRRIDDYANRTKQSRAQAIRALLDRGLIQAERQTT